MALSDWLRGNQNATPQEISDAINAHGGLTQDAINAVVQQYGSNPTSVQTAYNELNTPGSLNRNEWFMNHPNPRGFVIGDPAGFNLSPLIGLAASYFGAPLIGEALELSGTAGSVVGNAVINAVSGKSPEQIAASAITGTAGGLVGDAVANPFGDIDLSATDKSLGDAGNAKIAADAAAAANAATPLSKIGNQIPGSLGTGTYNSIPDLSSSVLTPPAQIGQLTGGAPLTAGSFSPAATGAMGANLGGAATDAFGNIIPANAGNAAGTAAAAISSGAVPSGLVNDGGAGSINTGTNLSSLLTPGNALLAKGLLDTAGSSKAIAGINSAAATQQAAYEQSKKDLAGLYANQKGYQKPYMATGTNALSNLGALGTGTYQMYDEQGNPTGTGTGSGYLQHQFDATDLAKGLAPNYDFMLQQGQMANQRVANMAGGGFGGNAIQGMNKFTQDYAGNAYQNAFTNYQNQRQNIFGDLSKLADVGQGAANQLTGATGTYGTNLTNLNVGNAAAQAAAQVAAAQTAGTNLSNLANTGVVATLLNQNPAAAASTPDPSTIYVRQPA